MCKAYNRNNYCCFGNESIQAIKLKSLIRLDRYFIVKKRLNTIDAIKLLVVLFVDRNVAEIVSGRRIT